MSRAEGEDDLFINGGGISTICDQRGEDASRRRNYSNGRIAAGGGTRGSGHHPRHGHAPHRLGITHGCVNAGCDDEMKITGYSFSRWRRALALILTVCTLGLLRLVLYWKPHWKISLLCNICSLDRAEIIVLQDQYKQYFVEDVLQPPQLLVDSSVTFSPIGQFSADDRIMTRGGDGERGEGLYPTCYSTSGGWRGSGGAGIREQLSARYFENKRIKYCWNAERQGFEKLKGPEFGQSCSYFHDCTGLTVAQQNQRRDLYGPNAILVHVTPIIKLLYTEALDPFYMFQVFSCTLWFLDQYFYFASCIIIISVISLTVQIREIRQTQRALKKTISSSDISTVLRPPDPRQDAQRDPSRPVIQGTGGQREEEEDYCQNPSIKKKAYPHSTARGGVAMNNGAANSASLSGGTSVSSAAAVTLGLNKQMSTTGNDGEQGVWETVDSQVLVPGDVIEIPRHGCTLQCDAVLINGNCIVNESMLTGESVPVMKTPIPNPSLGRATDTDQIFNPVEHSRHTLFCGTKVIQTRYYGNQKVKAVVIRTGFTTAKGELVRSIMFPKPLDFKFRQDTFKFIASLAFLAGIGMIYTLVLMISREETFMRVFVRTLDLVTIIIPPSLPAAMTIGIVFAQKRLRAHKVFCISPRSINLCGAIDVFCFDKTGTLTEDGLDMWGVRPVRNQLFEKEEKVINNLAHDDPVLVAMATCHSLTRIEGELVGDPMDLKMFESTDWELTEPGEETAAYDTLTPTIVRPRHRPPATPHISTFNLSTPAPRSDGGAGAGGRAEGFYGEGNLTKTVSKTSLSASEAEIAGPQVGIVRQFTFSSKLQRMSVIVRSLQSQSFELYAKGSPEMITSLSKPETVPEDIQEVLMTYTQQGFRVIALAHRRLKLSYHKVQRVQREAMECKLTFLGLVVLENQLKPQSAPIIRRLKDANIRTVMVTGDNMLTALSVARDSQMISRGDKVVLVTVATGGGNQGGNREGCGEVTGVGPEIRYKYAEDVKSEEADLQSPPPGTPNGLLCDEVVLNLENTKSVLHFAITGKSWAALRKYHPDIVKKLVVRGTVFARFSPDEKQQLIESLQELGYYVGMCGDGANDCGALKTAHTGISLSEAEASVASPFTCKEPNIGCVIDVIREGRAALVTSFGIFKYMAGYSLTQFMAVCLLYWVQANLTDFMFLYIDLVLQTTLSITFCYTRAHGTVVPKKPKVSLIAVTPILSIVSQLLLNLCFQLIAWKYTTQQPWFEPYILPDPSIRDFTSHEVTAVFTVSAFQYITMAITFSKGVPYRKPILTNYLFLINILIATLLTAFLVLYPFQWLAKLIQLLVSPSVIYRFFLVGLAGINFFLSLIVEMFVVDTLVADRIEPYLATRCAGRAGVSPDPPYKIIEKSLSPLVDWPESQASDLTLAELMKQEMMGGGGEEGGGEENRGDEDSDEDDESGSEGEVDLGGGGGQRKEGRRKRLDSSVSGVILVRGLSTTLADDDNICLVPDNDDT